MPKTPQHSPDQDPIAARLLALLDHAYDAAENPNGFDGLFSAADRYFFPNAADHGVAIDVVEADNIERGLDGHITRLQALVDRSESGIAVGNRGGVGPQLANLIISDDGRKIVGNAVASNLLDCTFPTKLSSLNITAATHHTFNQCLENLRSGLFEGSCVITVQNEDSPKPFLARCTKLQSRLPDGTERRGLSVAINHLDWREDSLKYAADTFTLTKAETVLLNCFLDGQSSPQAAASLGKSKETVKAQAKSILRKTGSTQMSDVIHFMTSYAFMAEPTRHTGTTSKTPFSIQGDHQLIQTSQGRKIQVNRYGLKGGRPLLFFHGLYQGPFLTNALDAGFHALGFDVIAPSRPGFNRTDPPANWADFNDTVTADVLAVCTAYNVSQTNFLVHHAGISFACRAGRALNSQVGAAIMIGAGVPIKDYMLKTMNTEARVAAAAAKYSPKLLDMLLRLGIAKWRRQGPYAYLNNLFEAGQPDRETLDDPETGPVMERGILHMISQGAPTIMHDGFSALSDWEPEYAHLPKKQLWLHGAHDPVMNFQFVIDFLAAQGQHPPVIYPNRGGDVLLAEAGDVLERIGDFLSN